MNYTEFVGMTNTSGVYAKYQFRLNSAFDPNYTEAGHQPLGFDQWSAFYNHYVVESCQYDCQIQAYSGASETNMAYAVYVSDDATVPSTVPDLTENGAQVALWNVNTPPHTFKGRVDVSKFFNRKSIGTDSELRALVTANPTEVVFITIYSVPSDGASTISNAVLCNLKLRVRFMEPKDLAAS
jgi:hypothetical protein